MVGTITNDTITTASFSCRESLLEDVRAKLPRYGDRSKLIVRLLEMYINDEVEVKIKSVERKM